MTALSRYNELAGGRSTAVLAPVEREFAAKTGVGTAGEPMCAGTRSHMNGFMQGREIASDDPPRPSPSRRPGLEAFRVGMTLCVVALHAGIAYLSLPFPGLAWSTHDQPSAVADVVCWLSNSFVMPAFFLLSGYGAVKLMDRLGPGDFARHRVKRIGGALLFGMVVILPLDLYAWMTGWAADGVIEWRKLKSLKFADGVDDGLWGLSHLWFLAFLLIYSFAHAAVRSRGVRMSQSVAERVTSPVSLFALASAASLVLFWEPRILLGFRHSFVPYAENLLYFAPVYTIGVALGRSERVPGNGLAGSLAFIGYGLTCWILTSAARSIHLVAESTDSVTLLTATAGYTFAGWSIALGLFGVAVRSTRSLSRPSAYLAAASFWIYLFHHPIVGVVQVVLKFAPLSSTDKFIATFALAMTASLLTFEFIVRRTRIAALLGVPTAFRRERESHATTIPIFEETGTASSSSPTRKAA